MEILNFSLLLTIFSGRRLDFNRHKILHENLKTELGVLSIFEFS